MTIVCYVGILFYSQFLLIRYKNANLSFLHSVQIKSREQLQQYKKGLLGIGATNVEVLSSAKCSLSDVESIFTQSDLLDVVLRLKDGAYIRVSPGSHKVKASLKHDTPRIAELLQGMKDYETELAGDAVVTDDDLDAIIKWFLSAQKISITGNGNVAYRLLQRLDKVNAPSLRYLALTVDRQSYAQLDTAKFMAKFVETSTIVFTAAADMPKTEFDEFTKNKEAINLFTKSIVERSLTFNAMTF